MIPGGAFRQLRQELFYGFRALARDNAACAARARRLLEQERWPAEKLLAMRRALLHRTLTIAAQRIPFYRNIEVPASPAEAERALEDIPVVSKEDLLGSPEQFYPRRRGAAPWRIAGRTSGTTGTPLTVYRSLDSVVWENAFIRRHWRWSGYEGRMRRATLRGDMAVPPERTAPPFWSYNRYENQLLLSSRHLREGCYPAIADKLAEFAPYLLQAYPSTAYDLACHLREQDRWLRIPYVYTGSEPLYPFQRLLIEERFGARVMDFYGMAERVAFAAECEQGSLHLVDDYSWVELVDDKGRPTEGEGYIVGTTFHNSAMPLVRYRLSDQTRLLRAPCACGRSYPTIQPVTGKVEDLLLGGDGRRVSASVLTFAFKGLEHIRRAQVAQTGPGEWEIRVVPMPSYGEEQKRRLIGNVRELVDPTVRVSVVEVQDIPRTEAGKYQWVINEWARRQGTNEPSAMRTPPAGDAVRRAA
jgi:phenylacetate-CoA ligase